MCKKYLLVYRAWSALLKGSMIVCWTADLSLPAAKDCTELACYFGASCIQDEYDKKPRCACDMKCSTDKSQQQPVCASDGKTYGSECQLKQFSCRDQKDIVVSAFGPCRGNIFNSLIVH